MFVFMSNQLLHTIYSCFDENKEKSKIYAVFDCYFFYNNIECSRKQAKNK